MGDAAPAPPRDAWCMVTTVEAPASPATRRGRSNPLAIGFDRVRIEVLQYVRRPMDLVFNFFLPILLFIVFASAFSTQPDVELPGGETVSQAQMLLPGLVAYGVVASGMQNLGTGIGTERFDGTLRRLAGMPLPVSSYFLGKFGQVLITALAQLLVLLAVAHFLFGVDMPQTAEQWGVFAGMWLLGLLCSALLGIAISRLPRSQGAVPGVVLPLVLLPMFISGIFVTHAALPDWLMQIAYTMPFAWIAHALRFALQPDVMRMAELNEAWNIPLAFIVVAAWTVGAAILAFGTFRWRKE